MNLSRSAKCLLAWCLAFGSLGPAGALTCDALAQGPVLEPALEQAVKDYDKAQIAGDRAELDRLVATDYLIIRADGSVGDKAVLLRIVAGPGVKNDPYVVESPFVRVYGESAILGGWVHLTGTDHGKPYVQNARFADTWVRRSGRWQVVFTSVTATEKR